MTPEILITDQQKIEVEDWLEKKVKEGSAEWLGAATPTTDIYKVGTEPLVISRDKFGQEPKVTLLTSQEIADELKDNVLSASEADEESNKSSEERRPGSIILAQGQRLKLDS